MIKAPLTSLIVGLALTGPALSQTAAPPPPLPAASSSALPSAPVGAPAAVPAAKPTMAPEPAPNAAAAPDAAQAQELQALRARRDELVARARALEARNAPATPELQEQLATLQAARQGDLSAEMRDWLHNALAYYGEALASHPAQQLTLPNSAVSLVRIVRTRMEVRAFARADAAPTDAEIETLGEGAHLLQLARLPQDDTALVWLEQGGFAFLRDSALSAFDPAMQAAAPGRPLQQGD